MTPREIIVNIMKQRKLEQINKSFKNFLENKINKKETTSIREILLEEGTGYTRNKRISKYTVAEKWRKLK